MEKDFPVFSVMSMGFSPDALQLGIVRRLFIGHGN
jgi:hypothetical protein